MPVHPTAIIAKGAEIDATADVGPLCSIGPKVKLGPQVRLMSHVVVAGRTTIGARCVVHPFAVIGGDPQDKKYTGEDGRLVIGEDTVLREGVTVNIGTQGGLMETRIGSDCLLMAYSHVAHDCCIGDGVILANGVALAGHVSIGEQAILGGLSAVHQFCRVGRYAFIGGGSMIAQDVPPFCVAQGDRAELAGINVVGLKRASWRAETVRALHQAYRCIFVDSQTQAAGLQQALSQFAAVDHDCAQLCQFISDSQRGVCHARRVQHRGT